MYVGGQFDALQDAALHAAITRPNFAAFSATTGAISATVAPTLARPELESRRAGWGAGRRNSTSPKSIKKYKAYAEQWGLSAADMTQVGGPAVALDFTTVTLRAAS